MTRAPNNRSLTLLPLIGITYCMVSGGPFGLEDLVHAAGYRQAMLILLVTPLLWSVPVTAMVSELAGAFPDNGGFYLWVTRGLGRFFGFQEVWLSMAASIFDMAIYPTLFVFYLGRLWPWARQGKAGILIGLIVILICVALNLLGAKTVGGSSVLMTALLLSPFAVIGFYSLGRTAAPVAAAPAHSDMLAGLLVAVWNYMGWDNTSTIAGEVRQPGRTFPLAMGGALLLVMATYIVPIALVSHSGIAPEAWETGSWVDVAGVIAGRATAVAVMLAGMISSIGMFNALVLSYSQLPAALADDGFLPALFGRRSARNGAPWFSVIVCAAAWAACLGLGFVRLVILDTMLYGLSLLLEFAALVALRIREPELVRPFKIPGGLAGTILTAALPLPIIAISFVRSLADDGSSINGLALGGSLIAAGIAIYAATAFWRKRGLR